MFSNTENKIEKYCIELSGLIGDVGSKIGVLLINFQFLVSARLATSFIVAAKFKQLLLCTSVLEGSNVISLEDSHL